MIWGVVQHGASRPHLVHQYLGAPTSSDQNVSKIRISYCEMYTNHTGWCQTIIIISLMQHSTMLAFHQSWLIFGATHESTGAVINAKYAVTH